jgi:hypothetical protein
MKQTPDRTEANRLYWETDESVADIASRLDMSRRALYEAIEPLPSGAACPTCGAPLSFENRSARLAGEATCPVCTAAAAGPTESDLPLQSPEGQPDERLVVLGGAAAAGVALGALLTLMVVPRR